MDLLFFCKISFVKNKKYIRDWRDKFEYQV